MSTIYNFYAGPAVIYDEVLARAKEEFLDFADTGMSVLEISHRAKAFDEVVAEAEANMKELMGLGDDYRVLFLQGGASTQFSMLPMNFLPGDGVADYILTGSWSEKAMKEAKKIGGVHAAFEGGENHYRHIPGQEELTFSDAPAYVHMTTNNTIYGTEFHYVPETDAPLVADMSSDILSGPVAFDRFSLIYAGAQKNLGPAGVTVVVLRKSFLEKAGDVPATMLKYATHAEKNSLYNTPPVFSVYMVNLVLRHLKSLGGLPAAAKTNAEKAKYIYDAIDSSDGFYRGHAEKESRSLMNITFTMADADLEKRFVAEAEAEGFIGLKGHRSVGGLRASVYNAMPVAGAGALADFMAEFMRKNG